MSKLTLEELQYKKEELENALSKLRQDFERETGLRLSEVFLGSRYILDENGERKSRENRIITKIEL